MNFGFRAEVGYEPKKDVTFLRTNTEDFDKQLTFPVARGSEEDKEIRTLLEEQEIVDFTALSKAVTLPSFNHKTFGLVGADEDDTLHPFHHDHVVLFGKEGSGAVNLIRFWLLWAARENVHIISISNPGLYGMEAFIPPALVHHFDPEQSLKMQFENSSVLTSSNRQVLVLVGAGYEPVDCDDTEFIESIHNEDDGRVDVFSLIHRNLISDSSESFFGSEGENVSYAVIGDVNEHTAKIVGDDVPTRNPRGVAWFKHHDEEESKRVRTFLVPSSYSRELLSTVAWV